MGNKIIIDGKEYALSDDLAVQIKAEVAAQEMARQMSENPFERMRSDDYRFITAEGCVCTGCETGTIADDERYSVANYCRDKGLMEQRALHETLNRLLWRYSEKHGGDAPWDGMNRHYTVTHSIVEIGFGITSYWQTKMPGCVYFRDEVTAQAAIEEVLKPFMSEHPEFVW